MTTTQKVKLMDNIFDTINISDLPKELIPELKLLSDKDEKLIRLFEEGPLGVTQILVGLYRKHGEIQTRVKITARLYALYKKYGYVEPVKKKGAYQLSELGRDVLRVISAAGRVE